MNNKVTLQDLIDILAEKHSMEKKDAELFVKSMFDLIENALATEKFIKIKGLGTFKLIEVDSRESINVNTGERIEIQGHSKVSFIPDTSLKDIINKPFSHFETVVLNENTTLEDTEIVTENPDSTFNEEASEDIIDNSDESDILKKETEDTEQNQENGLNGSMVINSLDKSEEKDSIKPVETEKVKSKSQEELTDSVNNNIDDSNIEFKENSSDFTLIQDVSDENSASNENKDLSEISALCPESKEDKNEAKPINLQDHETVTINDSVSPEQIKIDKEETTLYKENTKASKKNRITLIICFIFIGIIIISLGVFLVYMMNQNKSDNKSYPIVTPSLPKEVVVDSIKSNSASNELVNTSENMDSTAINNKNEIKETVIEQKTSNNNNATVKYDENLKYTIVGIKTTHTLKSSETLIKLSLKYYGNKKLWPYIVDYNKENIPNADNIKIGTSLKIPELKVIK